MKVSNIFKTKLLSYIIDHSNINYICHNISGKINKNKFDMRGSRYKGGRTIKGGVHDSLNQNYKGKCYKRANYSNIFPLFLLLQKNKLW